MSHLKDSQKDGIVAEYFIVVTLSPEEDVQDLLTQSVLPARK